MTVWPIYTGTRAPHDGIKQLPDPPNWRTFDGEPALERPTAADPTTRRRLGVASTLPPAGDEVDMVNAALFLRRPLLITGDPGVGKSSIAYKVSEELRLGPVLRWPITSRSTLKDGLYQYDPIGLLREEQHAYNRGSVGESRRPRQISPDPEAGSTEDQGAETRLGRHIRLGPLGTALLPYRYPRVLLIDEIDKSDIDLPNDLLNVFEEGEYTVEELTRNPDTQSRVDVMTADDDSVSLHRGHVRCNAFPFVVLTSNGERDFPPAFLRRCLRLSIPAPDSEQLTAIVASHLGPEIAESASRHIADFLTRRTDRVLLSTDQLLNAIYVLSHAEERTTVDAVIKAIQRPLSS